MENIFKPHRENANYDQVTDLKSLCHPRVRLIVFLSIRLSADIGGIFPQTISPNNLPSREQAGLLFPVENIQKGINAKYWGGRPRCIKGPPTTPHILLSAPSEGSTFKGKVKPKGSSRGAGGWYERNTLFRYLVNVAG